MRRERKDKEKRKEQEDSREKTWAAEDTLEDLAVLSSPAPIYFSLESLPSQSHKNKMTFDQLLISVEVIRSGWIDSHVRKHKEYKNIYYMPIHLLD